MKKNTKIAVLTLMVLVGQLHANNVQVTNLAIDNQLANANTVPVVFDVSWDNSWRDPENYDAVWLVIKYRAISQPSWQHATLALNGHGVPQGAQLEVSTDQVGVFVFRDATGNGTFNVNQLQLLWDYASDGVDISQEIEVKVFATEMVYVPEGAFWLGDGDNQNIHAHFESGTSGTPYLVQDENQIILGGGAVNSLGNNNAVGMYTSGPNDDFNDFQPQLLPQAFPKGFNAFYCMKYEVSQAQFVAFLNTISQEQATWIINRINNSIAPNVGPGLTWDGTPEFFRYELLGNHPNFETANEYAPMIFLNWSVMATYLDFIGLRPLSELEFEKACRGPINPVVGEYAWGTSAINLDALTLSDYQQDSEGIATGYVNDGVSGQCVVQDGNQDIPYLTRVGIFASHPLNSNRISSGATYWGIMEMSGNSWERCITVGYPASRNFTGQHGDGRLRELSATINDNDEGLANVPNWPGQFGNGVAYNDGVGFRGGGALFPTPNPSLNCRVSSRIVATSFFNLTLHDDGFRGVRSAN